MPRFAAVLATLTLGACGTAGTRPDTAPAELDRYDVVWTTPSRNASGSMPIGNGEVGLNVWVEGDSLLFYISRTDAWSESSRLLKLGRIRVRLTPNPFTSADFRQVLRLREGRIEISAGDTRLRVFVDAHHPVIHVTGESPSSITASVETWRREKRVLREGELESSWTMRGAPVEVWESGDVVNGNLWYHRNEHSVVPFTLKHQGLESGDDPLLHRTFGGVLSMSTQPGKFAIKIATHCAQTATADEWIEAVNRILKDAPDAEVAQRETARWWGAFWSRSWIFVEGATGVEVPSNSHPLRIGEDSNGGSRFKGEISVERAVVGSGLTLEARIKAAPGESGRVFDKITAGGSDGFLLDLHPGLALRLIVGPVTLSAPDCIKAGEWTHVAATVDGSGMRIFVNGKIVGEHRGPDVTQAYILQRWITACGGRGNYPIKFNGSIFTVEPAYSGGPRYDADWRRWGDAYWWQNTRLPYHPMLAAGDFDMMTPLFRFYESAVPICRARAKAYHGVEGVYFPETMTIFGTYANGDYGWDRKGHKPNEVLCPWWQYSWQQGLELVMLMLDYADYTGDARHDAMARDVLRYYESRFMRGGKIVIEPTQSVETYWYDVVNDTPSVAGLIAVLDRLGWPLRTAVPDLPVRDGRVLPAEQYKNTRNNVENPELYAVWPFRVATRDIGIETYKRRSEKSMNGWSYDGQCAALLGLTDEARRQILAKAANSNPNHRFPAMWGPNYDWLPDQCHGSNLMLTLQTMLMRCDGDAIHLLPAWPKEWDVSFKLHAPKKTIVEVVYRNGKIESLKVTPESRRKDVVR